MIFGSQQFGKLGHAHFLSFVVNDAIGTFVALLLLLGGPSAVFLRVSKVVIFPVNGVLVRRTFTHVFNKVFVAAPSSTDGDVPLHVSRHFQNFVAGSSRAHIRPAAIRPCATSTVNRFCRRDFWESALPAAGASPRSEMVPQNIYFRPAVTHAKPSCVSPPPIGGASFQYGPCAEALTGNVFDVGVKDSTLILGFNHSRSWLSSSAGLLASTGDRRALFMPLP